MMYATVFSSRVAAGNITCHARRHTCQQLDNITEQKRLFFRIPKESPFYFGLCSTPVFALRSC